VGPRAGLEAGSEEKNSQPLIGLEPPIIQPVAQRYSGDVSLSVRDQVSLRYKTRREIMVLYILIFKFPVIL